MGRRRSRIYLEEDEEEEGEFVYSLIRTNKHANKQSSAVDHLYYRVLRTVFLDFSVSWLLSINTPAKIILLSQHNLDSAG